MPQERIHTKIQITDPTFGDVVPVHFGERQCEPFASFGSVMRGHYVLHYVFSGKGKYYVGNEEHSVKAGQVFVIMPSVSTYHQADENDPWHHAWIAFESGDDLSALLSKCVIDAPRAQSIFRDICGCKKTQLSRKLFLCSKIFELLSLLNEQDVLPQKKISSYILKTINYIESNYSEQINVGKLAAALSLDRSYFSRAFKQAIGKSPQQYLVEYRLNKAAVLMAQHSYQPGEAGVVVGYPDIVNFSRMFKRYYGASPSEYIANSKRMQGAPELR